MTRSYLGWRDLIIRRIATLAVRTLLLLVRTLSAVCLAASVGVNFANIVGRYCFSASISWAEEGMLYLMIGCVFLGGGFVAWSGSHIRMDIFVRQAPKRIQLFFRLFSDALVVAACLTITAFTLPTVRELAAFDQKSLAGIPLAIPQSLIPIGFCLIALFTICRLVNKPWREEPTREDSHTGTTFGGSQ